MTDVIGSFGDSSEMATELTDLGHGRENVEGHRLHAGCRSGRLHGSPGLIPEEGSTPGFDIA